MASTSSYHHHHQHNRKFSTTMAMDIPTMITTKSIPPASFPAVAAAPSFQHHPQNQQQQQQQQRQHQWSFHDSSVSQLFHPSMSTSAPANTIPASASHGVNDDSVCGMELEEDFDYDHNDHDDDDDDFSDSSLTFSHYHNSHNTSTWINTSTPNKGPHPALLQQSPSMRSTATSGTPGKVLDSDRTIVTRSTATPRSFKSSKSSSSSLSTNNSNIQVLVGGEAFSFSRGVFESKVRGLPWKKAPAHANGCSYSLNSSPAAFEVLLDFILFGTLPAYDTLCKSEFDDLETMALALNLTPLILHFDRKQSKELGLPGRKNGKQQRKHVQVMLNGEGSSSKPNSKRATQCARWLGAICGVAETVTGKRRRRQRKQKYASSPISTMPHPKRLKTSHPHHMH